MPRLHSLGSEPGLDVAAPQEEPSLQGPAIRPRGPQADGAAPLPAPLSRWVRELLGAPPPAEKRADCDHCVMCPTAPAPPGLQRIAFSPRTRCCTYRPQLANHQVGAALADAASRTGIEQRLAAGEGTPLGLRVDPAHALLHRHGIAQAFGRSETLRCPHHRDDGGCGIWAHRNAACATWFCKHERGGVGAAMWERLRETFTFAERALALWCLEQLGLGAAQRQAAIEATDHAALDAAALDGRRGDPPGRALWGDWAGREAELYRACAELVAPLRWAAVERIGGRELAARAALAREAAATHADPVLPPRLSAGRFAVTGAHQGRLWLTSYREFDPVEVEPATLALVARCDGRRREEIVAEHERAGAAAPTAAALQRLVDFGIVTASPEGDAQGRPGASG